MRFGLTFMAAALTAPLLVAALATSALAKDMHYDCTKPGNANKTACKGAAPAAPAAMKTSAAKPAMPAMPAKPMATPASAPKEMHYDCSKAGNANKAACKGAAPTPAMAPAVPAKPAPIPMATAKPAAAPAPAMAAAPTRPAPAARPAMSSMTAGGAPRIVAFTEKNGKVVHFDCSKAGNFNKTACKS